MICEMAAHQSCTSHDEPALALHFALTEPFPRGAFGQHRHSARLEFVLVKVTIAMRFLLGDRQPAGERLGDLGRV